MSCWGCYLSVSTRAEDNSFFEIGTYVGSSVSINGRIASRVREHKHQIVSEKPGSNQIQQQHQADTTALLAEKGLLRGHDKTLICMSCTAFNYIDPRESRSTVSIARRRGRQRTILI